MLRRVFPSIPRIALRNNVPINQQFARCMSNSSAPASASPSASRFSSEEEKNQHDWYFGNPSQISIYIFI
jgi:hypothetical protein